MLIFFLVCFFFCGVILEDKDIDHTLNMNAASLLCAKSIGMFFFVCNLHLHMANMALGYWEGTFLFCYDFANFLYSKN